MRSLTTFKTLIRSSKGLSGWCSLSDEREQSCSTPRPVQGVLLNFGDRDLESDYRAEWASESFRADCGLYMLALSLWVIIWHTLYIAGDWRHVWSAANAVMCFCTLLGMRWHPHQYQEHRTLIVSATKLIATALATEIMLLPGSPTDSWLGYTSAMGVLSKVSMLLFTACFMQIPFREHVLVQGIQVGYCILHNGRMCSALEGRYLHIRGRCLRAADMLGALSYEAQAPLKMRPRSLGQDRACESVNAYLQILFGYAVSLLVLHQLEARSRHLFLRRRWRGAPQCAPRRMSCACFGALTTPVLFLLSAVLLWELIEGFWEARDSITGPLLGAVQAS
ncbi:g6819 [Coccomyxa viridis]|uniref:G6819 protein n=1 Tax=Coccomyxa viridis TaxID=1274662 RepID=A0ABP1FYV7_9CHLO